MDIIYSAQGSIQSSNQNLGCSARDPLSIWFHIRPNSWDIT
jgi:hypothetical protein